MLAAAPNARRSASRKEKKTSTSPFRDLSVVALIRTDATLDHIKKKRLREYENALRLLHRCVQPDDCVPVCNELAAVSSRTNKDTF